MARTVFLDAWDNYNRWYGYNLPPGNDLDAFAASYDERLEDLELRDWIGNYAPGHEWGGAMDVGYTAIPDERFSVGYHGGLYVFTTDDGRETLSLHRIDLANNSTTLVFPGGVIPCGVSIPGDDPPFYRPACSLDGSKVALLYRSSPTALAVKFSQNHGGSWSSFVLNDVSSDPWAPHVGIMIGDSFFVSESGGLERLWRIGSSGLDLLEVDGSGPFGDVPLGFTSARYSQPVISSALVSIDVQVHRLSGLSSFMVADYRILQSNTWEQNLWAWQGTRNFFVLLASEPTRIAAGEKLLAFIPYQDFPLSESFAQNTPSPVAVSPSVPVTVPAYTEGGFPTQLKRVVHCHPVTEPLLSAGGGAVLEKGDGSVQSIIDLASVASWGFHDGRSYIFNGTFSQGQAPDFWTRFRKTREF